MNKFKKNIIKAISLGVFTLVAILNVSCGQTSISAQTKIDKLDDLISNYAEYGKFNGSVLIAEEGKIVYKKGFGLANVEWNIPNQTDTKFRIASITKQFTAMLIVQLVSENKLDLHVPISTYLPDYPKKNADRITIHHLLTHTSGIPEFDDFVNFRDIERNPYRPEEMLDVFADGELQFTPGERFAYTNPGYVVLGVIIEKITGKSYEQVLQDKIFTPLGMLNTGYDNNRNVLKNRASGYANRYGRGDYLNTNYIDMSIPYAAGSIYSTVEDLYIWDQALYTEKLLPKKYMNLLFNTHIPARGRHYGYGWFINDVQVGSTDEQVQTVGHGGGINGFRTLITRIPSSKSSIILLNNMERTPLREMTSSIIGILQNKPYDAKKSIAYSLQSVIKKEGAAAGFEYYKKVKATSGYYLDEGEMNIAGYELLQAGKIKESAPIFKLNVEGFPKSSNVYDSYGEVLLMLGDTTRAIENYKKSIVLDPGNRNGLRILKSLDFDIKSFDLVKTDDTWGKEIIKFPIHFAEELSYEGYEEAQFSAGWREKDSPEFWTYVFVWNINTRAELTERELETNMQFYFDGLMKVVNKDENLVPPNSIAQLHEQEGINGISTYTGTVKIFDAFITQKVMTLNVLIENHYCKEKKKSVILFKFSPKAFGDEIWLELDKIKLRNSACEK